MIIHENAQSVRQKIHVLKLFDKERRLRSGSARHIQFRMSFMDLCKDRCQILIALHAREIDSQLINNILPEKKCVLCAKVATGGYTVHFSVNRRRIQIILPDHLLDALTVLI